MLYFVAIVVPQHINEQVLVWKKYMEKEYGCKVALRSPAHITLVPPFSMTKEKELSNYLREFAGTENKFTIRLKNFDHFKPRVIFVHVDPGAALIQLKERLDSYLPKSFRFKKEQRPFHPHITIANRDLAKKDFPAAWAYFEKLSFDAEFTVDNISLLRHNNKEWQVAESYKFI